jgi:DNA (cytosine-5)-methyltransferase 1
MIHESVPHCVIPQTRDAFSLDDQWMAAVEASRTLRPPVLRRVLDNVELSTGWATVPFLPPTQQVYDLASVLDVDDGQDWWEEADVAKHYELMESPSRARVDELLRIGATEVGTAFRRTRREKPRTEVRFDIAGCLRTPKGGSAKQLVVAIIKGRLKMRWTSPVEYARLQGAGDFNITVPPIQAMYDFGDAVCVPAISWIDANILTPVFEASAVATAVA